MTREDIDRTLALFDAGENGAKDRWGVSEIQALAEIVADQERRLRALEDANGFDCGPESDGHGERMRTRAR